MKLLVAPRRSSRLLAASWRRACPGSPASRRRAPRPRRRSAGLLYYTDEGGDALHAFDRSRAGNASADVLAYTVIAYWFECDGVVNGSLYTYSSLETTLQDLNEYASGYCSGV